MSITSTIAATRRGFAGLIVTAIATASAGAWALTAGATGPADEPTTTTAAVVEDMTVGRPAAAASDLVPAATRPIVLGPYPWPWITICRNGTDPVVVADAYHGVGVTVCR